MKRLIAGAGLLAFAMFAGSPGGWAQEPTTDQAGVVTEAMLVAPEEGGPRRWQVVADGGLDLRDAPAGDAPVLRTLAHGAILSNLGCERAGDRVWCAVRPLGSRSRGFAPAEALRPAAGPDGTVPMGVDNSMMRARQGDFDASGDIPCAQNQGQPMGVCAFGVARSGGGDATVVVTFSNGFKRMLFFRHGAFIAGDATMSGTGRDADWHRDGDRHVIRVDDQRYELTDAAVFGGRPD